MSRLFCLFLLTTLLGCNSRQQITMPTQTMAAMPKDGMKYLDLGGNQAPTSPANPPGK
jgi:hypothetical protein